MKLRGVLIVGLLGVAGIAIPPAHAASTRAEYIAQADPICQSFVGPVDKAERAYAKNYREWKRRLSKGSLKGWVRQTKRTARSLVQLAEILTRMHDQLAAVAPPVEDATTVATWLSQRREADEFAKSAASAFSRFKFGRFRKQFRRAGAAEDASIRTISGFGFQVCGVSV